MCLRATLISLFIVGSSPQGLNVATLSSDSTQAVTDHQNESNCQQLFSSEVVTDQYITTKPEVIVLPPLGAKRIKYKPSKGEKFWVFEAHTVQHSLLMSYSEKVCNNSYVNSTDPGLVYQAVAGQEEPFVFIVNFHNLTVSALVKTTGYTATDPVPGACNSLPGVKVKPYLTISWDSSVIKLNFSRAGVLNQPEYCKKKVASVDYQVFRYYLPEREFNEQRYFDALIKLSSVDSLHKYAGQLTSLGKSVNRLVLSSYPGTGSVYLVLATYENGSTLYSAGHTYACDLDQSKEINCRALFDTSTWVICALSLFVGLFLSFAGHHFFRCSQFIFGFYCGSFIGYILLQTYLDVDYITNLLLTAACGLAVALIVLTTWWFLGIPVVSVLLPVLEVGVLAASTVMFLPFTNVPAFTVDATYWLVFVCVVLAAPILLLAFTQKASILSCVLVGVFSVVVPIDHYVGSNLRYLFLNILRRATVPEFREAITVPPLQTLDLAVLVGWLGLTGVALIIQMVIERQRPPFPPSPFQQWRWQREMANMQDEDDVDERSPLIRSDVTAAMSQASESSPVVGFILGHSSPAPSVQGSYSRSARSYGSRRLTGSQSSNQLRDRDIFKPPTPETDAPPAEVV